MIQKLKCVIVDDDAVSILTLNEFCSDIPYVEVVGKFQDSMKFIGILPTLDFDVCMVNINMPRMNGIKIAKQLNGKQVIFMTGGERMLRDAINMAPVDIVLKPLKKERVNVALSRAYQQILSDKAAFTKAKENSQGYALFSSGEREKIRVRLSDILLVYADETNCRHKHIIMRDGGNYFIMHCTFEKLLEMAPHLVRVNRTHVVATEIVKKYECDLVTLDCPAEDKKFKQITLARTYRNEFKRLVAC